MKNNVNYKLDDSISIIKDNSQLELSEHQGFNLKDTLVGKRRISVNTFELKKYVELSSEKKLKSQSQDLFFEKKFELALIQSKFNYCRSEQLIESIEGSPDFVIPKYRIAIFCVGDLQEGYYSESEKIKNSKDIISAKIDWNIIEDNEVNYNLNNSVWKVFRFQKSDIEEDVESCIIQISKYIEENETIKNYEFNFVDLYAGIGGFRIPLEVLGGKCLGFSEIDKYAIETYKNNFCDLKNDAEIELGSITNIEKMPFSQIDLIVGGVPCQSWSVAGKMKGFEDPRGKLWHDTIRVVKLNEPKAFIFENVKGLIDPRNKANLDIIVKSFEELGYKVKYQLLNSYDFGLPQNRDRIFIVGIRKDLHASDIFKFPSPQNKKSFLSEIIDGVVEDSQFIKKQIFNPKELFGDKIPMGRNRFQKIDEFNDFFIFCDTRNGHTTIHSWDMINTSKREKEICMMILRNRRKRIYGVADGNPLSFAHLKFLISDLEEAELISLVNKKILKYLDGKGYVFVNSKNSSGINNIYRIYLPHSSIFSTLTATGTKDMVALINIQAKTPLEYKERFIEEIIKPNKYRSISAKEAGKLQGFPKWFAINKDEKLAKKQFGNAVSTNVIYNLAKSLINTTIFNKKTK